MFNSISWQEFLHTALIALGLYYVVAVVIFYSRDMVARFKNAAQPEPVDSERRNHPLMGQIRKDTPKKHEHIVEAWDLVIDPRNSSRAERSEEAVLINSVSHLLREIKVLARVGGDEPHYNWREDKVKVPHRENFILSDEYYATLFHELAHNAAKMIMPHRTG